ncbi:MAG: UvrD-helicase domain-containing protein, partial [Acidobacteriota bacterium]
MSAGSEAQLRAADGAARRAAQTVFDRPLVLEAGAGTGKTTALTARVVWWCLGEGWERALRALAAAESQRVAERVLDRVVAITFTDAAAAEMADRIGKALATLASGVRPMWLADLPHLAGGEAMAARARALLVALDHLNVSTIHAFCLRLLRRYPLEAGLHPRLEVDADGRLLAGAAQDAVEAYLRDSLGDPPDRHLLALASQGVGPQELVDAVARLAEEGIPSRALADDPFTPAGVAELVAGLDRAVESFVTAGGGRLRDVQRGLSITLATLAALEVTRETLARAAPTEKAGLDALCQRVRETWTAKEYQRLATWAGGELGDAEGKAVGEDAVAVAEAAADLAPQIEILRGLRPALLEHARLAVMPLLAEVERELRSTGAITFNGLLRHARELLAGRPEVAARERGEIDQLLVDEVQDTDRLQCEIVRLLALDGPAAERPGLFLVGDPKQSIYGWRSADLAAYEELVGLARAAGGEVHGLCVSFRSPAVILDEVERCVAPVMIERAGLQPPFQKLVPSEANAARDGFKHGRFAPVEHWVSWRGGDDEQDGGGKTRAGEATEIEAAALARDLRVLHDESGVAWSEVGVLLRATSDLDEYLQALRDAGIPYAVEGDRQYFRRREVIEAAALASAILDPADHLALVAWLRSASVGVPDAALVPLWTRGVPALLTELASGDDTRLARLAEIAAEVAASLPAGIPGLERVRGWERSFTAACRALGELRAAFGRECAAVFVERMRQATLIEVSEAARYLGAYRLANLERFFRRLLAALEESACDPAVVLRELRRAVVKERPEEEGRPRGAVREAVRVMTIHKAKGLDFCHLYLLQTHHGERGGSEPANAAAEHGGAWEYRLFGAPTPGWSAVAARRLEVAREEAVRTLYVALTRAKDRLVVAGNWPQRPGGGGGSGTRTHLQLLARRLPADLDLAAAFEGCAAAGEWSVDAG